MPDPRITMSINTTDQRTSSTPVLTEQIQALQQSVGRAREIEQDTLADKLKIDEQLDAARYQREMLEKALDALGALDTDIKSNQALYIEQNVRRGWIPKPDNETRTQDRPYEGS